MNKKILSLNFVLMLVISTVAFAFMIGSETKMVNAAPTYQVGGYWTVNGQKFTISRLGVNGEPTSVTDSSGTVLSLNRPSGSSSYFASGNTPSLTPDTYSAPAPTPPAPAAAPTGGPSPVAVLVAVPSPTPAAGASENVDVQKKETPVATATILGDKYTLKKDGALTITSEEKVYTGVTEIYQNGDKYYAVVDNKAVVVTSDSLSQAGFLNDDNINYDLLISRESSPVTVLGADGTQTLYRSVQVVGAPGSLAPGLESSSNNGKDWADVPISDLQSLADSGIISGNEDDGYDYSKLRGSTEKIMGTSPYGTKMVEVTSPDGGVNYYTKDSEGEYGSIPISDLPANAQVTKWVGSTPAEFSATNSDTGARTIYTLDTTTKKGYTTSVDRGTVKVFGKEWGFGWGQLAEGVKWAGISAGIILTLGPLFGMDQEEASALAGAVSAGLIVGKGLYGVLGKGGENSVGIGNYLSSNADGSLSLIGRNSGIISGAVGVAASWLVYNAMWSKTKTNVEIVTFDCLPWQAPHGGEDCELCNDPTLPCSEYRCKSLGQSCAIVNKGTTSERCVNVNPRDVSPPVIKPLGDAITEGYQYFDVKEMPPGAGFKIKSSKTETGCIPPFTPIEFGIETDEPSQCKIDIEARGNYSKMSSYFGGNNLYSYNHTEYLTLPSAKDFKNSSITLKNGKELTFYMRCQDASGNSNEADYALTLCVDPSPDTTAPVVQGTSINNNGCVAATTENATVDFYINEPAQCRWGFTDSGYDLMKNDMTCANTPIDINALQSYTCRGILNGISRDGTKFYVRCKDQPLNVNESSRNTNKESYIFNLRGSSELKLKTIQPNETIFGVINPAPVELYAETLFGCDNNKAVCYYSTSDSLGSFVQFFDTNNADGVHTQRLDLTQGRYTYFVRCVDAGGNLVQNSTAFTVNIDTNAPVIARAYEEDNYLKIVTPRNSECVYTNDNCDYLFNEGIVMPYANSTTHITEWSPSKKYYIKCKDEFRTEPVDCSLIVGPTENFL